MHRQPRMSGRFKGAQIGGRLDFGDKESYQVVGIFTAGGSSAESEVWADFKDVVRNTGREGSVSCVQLRAADRAAYEQLRKTIEDDTRFKLAAIPESRLFRDPEPVEHLPQGGRHPDRRPPDVRRHVRRGQHDVRRRQLPDPRDRHDAGAWASRSSTSSICFLGESLILCSARGPASASLAAIPLNAWTYETSDFNSFASMTVAFRLRAAGRGRSPSP